VLGPAGGAAMLAPFFDWFDPDAARGPVEAAMRVALAGLSAPVLSLRDLHAENIVWQPDLAGLARVGLLDFQDAWRAPPAYDLASLLDDPRREVSHRAEAATLERFAALTAADPARTEAERAILSVQRNLRILGIFARLIRRDGKPRYAAFVPRTIRHLHRHLAHPALGDLRPLVAPRLRRTPSWA